MPVYLPRVAPCAPQTHGWGRYGRGRYPPALSFPLSIVCQYLYESRPMKPDTQSQSRPHVLNNALGFQRLKGFFILDFLPFMTRFKMATVLDTYVLLEFKEDFKIDYRTVMFWHASLKNEFLKIIVYDIYNKVLITKLHNIETEDQDFTDWFLIDTDIFKNEML